MTKENHICTKFKIALYQQRHLFFWWFIALLLVVLCVILTKAPPTISNKIMAFCITLLGLFASLGWFYVVEGSKLWQENWESPIDFSEDGIIGSLYKTIIGDLEEFVSVNKGTLLIIRAAIIVWGIASYFTTVNILCSPEYILCPHEEEINYFIGWLKNWVYWSPIVPPLIVWFFVKYLAEPSWRTKLPVIKRSFPNIKKKKEACLKITSSNA